MTCSRVTDGNPSRTEPLMISGLREMIGGFMPQDYTPPPATRNEDS
jgi:hypothetical protein